MVKGQITEPVRGLTFKLKKVTKKQLGGIQHRFGGKSTKVGGNNS
ncbi:hypothetical protein [Neobacillus soli]|nr:hypothetical protein [Neobacillus soli]